MKNQRSILLALTVLLLATAAQAQTTNVKASIPFDFVVGDHAYTAGEYTVKSLSQSSAAIRIDNADESEKGITLSNACQKAQPAAEQPLFSIVWVTTISSIRFGRREIPLAASSVMSKASPACQEQQQARTRDRCRKHLPLTPRHAPRCHAEKEGTFPAVPSFYLRPFIFRRRQDGRWASGTARKRVLRQKTE